MVSQLGWARSFDDLLCGNVGRLGIVLSQEPPERHAIQGSRSLHRATLAKQCSRLE